MSIRNCWFDPSLPPKIKTPRPDNLVEAFLLRRYRDGVGLQCPFAEENSSVLRRLIAPLRSRSGIRFAVYFRFIAALLLVVVISMAGVVLEKHTVDMRRAVSRQYYQTDLLLDLQVKLRLETQRLTAPSQLEQLTTPGVGVAQQRSPEVDGSESPEPTESRSPLLPLLRFRHPFRPEGID